MLIEWKDNFVNYNFYFLIMNHGSEVSKILFLGVIHTLGVGVGVYLLL